MKGYCVVINLNNNSDFGRLPCPEAIWMRPLSARPAKSLTAGYTSMVNQGMVFEKEGRTCPGLEL